jgi:biopolymer transport protein ExbD
MKRNPRKQRLVAEINITPFTDVILVLLVIFMITTPLMMESSIRVKLPPVKSGSPMEGLKQEEIYITITNEGLMYLDDKLVSDKELIEKVGALYRDNPGISVILRSDRFVEFKDIVHVLDFLTGLGITKLNISGTKNQ